MKKVAVMFANGSEEVEALSVVDCLRRGEVSVDMIGIEEENYIISSHNVKIEMNKILKEINFNDYDAVVIPGGIPGAINLKENDKVIEFIKNRYENGKLCAAMCAGPIVLAEAGIVEGKKITSFPNEKFSNPVKEAKGDYKEDIVVKDNNIITARGPALSIYFGLEILEYLTSKENRDNVAKAMLIPLLEDALK